MYVSWPSRISKYATAWKLVEYAGLAKSSRQALQYTNWGYVYLDGNQISRKTNVPIGKEVTMEVRIPNGRTKELTFMVVLREPNTTGPATLEDTTYHRGLE